MIYCDRNAFLDKYRGGIDINYDIHKVAETVLAFHSETDNSKLLSTILTKMMELTNSDAGTLYIKGEGELRFNIIKNMTLGISQAGDKIKLQPIPIDEDKVSNVSVYSLLNNEIVSIDDVYSSKLFNFEGPKKYDALTGYRTKSLLTIPLVTDWTRPREVIGVIQLLNRVCKETGEIIAYGDVTEPPILPALAKIAANTLANQLHIFEIGQLFSSIVGVLIQAIDERSKYNSAHTINVKRYVTNFAKYLSECFEPDHPLHFNDNRIEELSMAALLHDIGKIITPLEIMDKSTRLSGALSNIEDRFDIKKLQLEIEYLRGKMSADEYKSILEQTNIALDQIRTLNEITFLKESDKRNIENLSKITYINKNGDEVPILDEGNIACLMIPRGTLTAEERVIMEEHVVHTGKMLDKITMWKYFRNVPEWAKAHHELLDGSGYPNKLSGDEIDLETRMLTIADIFEGLTSADRPYKKSIPVVTALEILDEMAQSGKLDKELVVLFTDSKAWEGQ